MVFWPILKDPDYYFFNVPSIETRKDKATNLPFTHQFTQLATNFVHPMYVTT